MNHNFKVDLNRLSILCFVIFCFSCDKKEQQAKSQDNTNEINSFSNIQEVEIEVVNKKAFDNEIISNGKLSALNKADINFSIGETIKRINVKNGDRVKFGDTLAVLQNYRLKNKFEQIKIQLANDKIRFNDILVTQGYNYNDLKSIPKDAINAAKIKSGYEATENELKLAEYNYKESFAIATISGIVANLYVKENNISKPNELFCSIIDNQHFEILFPVMESEIDLIKRTQKITIHPYFDEAFQIEGYISEVNPFVDRNGLVTIKAIINNKDKVFYEGMNVKVFLKLPSQNRLAVPKSAVVLRSEKPVVFTYKKGFAHWNYVKTGFENNTSIVIEEGIHEGDSVIFNGNTHLAHGASVKPSNL